MVKGVDVSHWRGEIDWVKVAQSGVKFAFSKSSGGVSYADPTYLKNIKGCKDNGIIYGAYHYFYPFLGGKKQAGYFIDVIGDDFQLPPVIDSERAYGEDYATVAQRTLECLHEVERLTGTKPMIYSNTWFGSLLSICNEFDLWLANYNPTPDIPTGFTEWKIWQYSKRGSVPGVPGYCDMNWWNGTLDELRDYCNLEPGPDPYVTQLNIPAGLTEFDIKVILR